MKMIEIFVDISEESGAMMYHIMLNDNGCRKRILTFNEYYEDFVEEYATNIARELGVSTIEWTYSPTL